MNKVILITGCSSGIGLETAKLFAEKGWTTYATVKEIDDTGTQELTTLNKALPNLHVLKLDVTNQQEVETVKGVLLKETGKVDVLVNNAGFGLLGPVESFSIEEIQAQFDVNFYGAIRMINAFLPIMRSQHSGKIINISSINGRLSFPMYGIYSASKFALETYSEVLAMEVRQFGIQVALVEPGSVKTSFSDNAIAATGSQLDAGLYEKEISKLTERRAKFKANNNSILKTLLDPKRLAKKVYKIANSERISLRYPIGIDSKMMLFLSKVLPERIRLNIIRKASGL